MIKRTISEYELRHTGDEMDRAELLACLNELKRRCEHSAEVEVSSVKRDLVSVRIETVDAP